MSPLTQSAFPHTDPAGNANPLIIPGLIAVGDGPAVVLLHSSMSSKTQWHPLMQRLAPQFRAIAVDLTGYGDNALARQRGEFSLDDEVDLVMSRLKSVTARNTPVHVVGHSYGGLVALRFVQRQPALVRSLSLFEPVAFSLFDAADPHADEPRRIAATVATCVDAHRDMDAAQAFVDYWCGAGSFALMPLPMRARCAIHARKVVLDFAAAFGCGLTLSDCRAIRAPTLLLGGTRSHDVVQRIVTMLATALPNSRSGWIRGDHMAPVNAGARVNPLFEAFIEMNEARSRGGAASNDRFAPLAAPNCAREAIPA